MFDCCSSNQSSNWSRERWHIPTINYEESETTTPDNTLETEEDDGKNCWQILKTKGNIGFINNASIVAQLKEYWEYIFDFIFSSQKIKSTKC